jgi:hypothetical protein
MFPGPRLSSAVIAGLPPQWPRSDPWSGHVGRMVGKVAGFVRVLWLPLPILIPPTTPHSLIILSTLYSLTKNGTYIYHPHNNLFIHATCFALMGHHQVFPVTHRLLYSLHTDSNINQKKKKTMFWINILPNLPGLHRRCRRHIDMAC